VGVADGNHGMPSVKIQVLPAFIVGYGTTPGLNGVDIPRFVYRKERHNVLD